MPRSKSKKSKTSSKSKEPEKPARNLRSRKTAEKPKEEPVISESEKSESEEIPKKLRSSSKKDTKKKVIKKPTKSQSKSDSEDSDGPKETPPKRGRKKKSEKIEKSESDESEDEISGKRKKKIDSENEPMEDKKESSDEKNSSDESENEQDKKTGRKKKAEKMVENEEAKKPENNELSEKSEEHEDEKSEKPAKKRGRKKNSNDSDESGKDEDYKEEEEIKPKGKSRKKLERKRKEKGEKPKKEPKKKKEKPKKFRKGKWNPDITLVTVDNERDSISDSLDVKCCSGCANRNVIRAVLTNNKDLLKECIKSNKISTLFDTWGPEIQMNSLHFALQNNNLSMALELLKGSRDCVGRARQPTYLIEHHDTGHVSMQAFGVRVRKVQMARGNRQGNNAFMEKQYTNTAYEQETIQSLLMSPNLTTETLARLIALEPGMAFTLYDNIIYAIISGNRKIAAFLINQIKDLSNYGFGNLHYEVLALDDEDLSEFHKASVHKKSTGNQQVTPTHCACINPNAKYLQALMNSDLNIQLTDEKNRKPIHYASACSGPAPLELIIAQGGNVNDLDNEKKSPLHYAALFGRGENIKIIGKAAPALLKAKDKQNTMPLHYACKYGHLDAVKAFIEVGAGVNLASGFARMSPLGYAAAFNHYEICEYLINNKARIMHKDKFKRTPLIMAVRNGNAKIASLLLQHGALWNEPDSSGNTPLHYAAAYGWPQCAEILVKAGADVNANSSWKISPLNIAMLKNHYGMVKYLLSLPGIDVNCKDEKGRTLVSLAIELETEEALEYMEYLLKEKSADPNIQDINGLSPLHYLLAKKISVPPTNYNFGQTSFLTTEEYRQKIEEAHAKRLLMINLLLKYGARKDIVDSQNRSLFQVCLENENYDLLEMFLEPSAFEKNKSLIFTFGNRIYDPIVKHSFDIMMKKAPPTKDDINAMNDQGFTPFLYYLKNFLTNASGYYQMIESYIEFELKRLKYQGETDFDKSKMNINYANYALYNQNNNSNPENSLIRNYNIAYSDRETIKELAKEEYAKTFVNVIINILEQFISLGADPKQKVGKLLQYRGKTELSHLIPNQQIQSNVSFGTLPGMILAIAAPLISMDMNPKIPTIPEDPLTCYGEEGLYNAWHFLAKNPVQEVVDYMKKLNVPMDEGDKHGNTPFMKSLNLKNCYPYMAFTELYQIFKAHGVNIDQSNSNGETPFLTLINRNEFAFAYSLLKDGANVNAMDKKGNYALKHLILRNDLTRIKELLVDYKADPNLRDLTQRTSLHLAINNSSPAIDSTSDLESMLMDYGADVNAVDGRGRTPLHYAFVKIDKWQDTSVIDPIETVTTLCSKINIKVDVQDNWGKTPLHYAAQRSSTICSVFLLNRGADIEKKDKFGNTPLAVAFLNNHPDYAITLIERNANVNQMVYPEYIDDEQSIDKKPQNTNMQYAGTFRNYGNNTENVFAEQMEDIPNSGSELSESSDEDLISNRTRSKLRNKPTALVPKIPGRRYVSGKTISENEESMFRIGIKKGWQGLLYLLLDKNYDYMRGMEDALSEKKFYLLLKLLKKTAKDEVVQRFNDKKQNLFHILAMHSQNMDYTILNEIYTQFSKRGVKHSAVDIFGRTALHYAVDYDNESMVSLLLNEKYDPNLKDLKGDNALTLSIKGSKITNVNVLFRSSFNSIMNSGGNINVLYHEPYYEKENKSLTEKEYMTTPIIHCCRYILGQDYEVDFKNSESLFVKLFQYCADASIPDSNKCDIFIYLAKENATRLLELAVHHVRNHSKNQADLKQKTALHYAVSQYELGSYQNENLVDMLLGSSFDYTIKDSKGFTPLDYAVSQPNGKLAKIFKKRGIDTTKATKVPIINRVQSLVDWKINFDCSKDAEEYLKKIQEAIQKEQKEQKAEVDNIGNQGEPLEVVYDDKNEPYETYMTKVDLKNGTYGEYLFYRMQLIRNTNRDVYMVYTRWGRIGETGAFQKTPLGSKEEAAKEFEKIYKSKSGNEWSERHNFAKQKHKYVPTKLKKKGIGYKQLLRAFNYKEIKEKTSLPKDIQKLMKLIVDVSIYEKALTRYGIDSSTFMGMKLDKEALLECQKILEELKGIAETISSERTKGLTANLELLEEKFEKASELSNKYYELFPQEQYNTSRPPVLDDLAIIKQQEANLDQVLNIEIASKILLGAQSRLGSIHPWDYCYNALGVHLDPLLKESEEYEILKKYISKSARQNNCYYYSSGIKIRRIFRVERRGEEERFKPFETKSNRWLLFHGSKTSNFIGILSQGLKVAPPDVAYTGWAFGRGIYFADMFAKSSGYCYTFSGDRNEKDKLMLMCEVALGKSKIPKAAQFTDTKFDHAKYDSLKVVGQNGPDPKGNLIMNDGLEIPLGNITSNEKQKITSFVQHNEYIITNEDQIRIRYLIQWS